MVTQQITAYNLPELLNEYDKVSKLILYIPNATISQYVHLIGRFALIEQLAYIELKLDTSTQFYNETSADGANSILALIKQFEEKLPSLKDLKLIFRERDFTLLSEAMKR